MSRALVWALTAWACAAPAAGASALTLVLPFENAGREPRVFWLGEGSAVILADDLEALGRPVVSRDDRLREIQRLDVPVVTALSHATAIRLGRAAGATEIVVGEFELSVDSLTVRARSIALDTGRMSPEITERGRLADIFGIYAAVARRLAPNPAVPIEAMEQGHPPIAAFELYVKGLLAEALTTRVAFLSQALRQAPDLQRARLALWHAHTELGEHPRALVVARQVPPGHRFGRQAGLLAGLSLLNMARHQEAYDALIALNRSAPDVTLLNNIGVVQLRRPATAPGGKAVAFLEEARRMDGADADVVFNLGYAYWLNRDIIAASYWLREAVRRQPSDAAAHYVLGVAYQAAGNSSDAAREKEIAVTLSPDFGDWDARQAGANVPPRGLERVKTALAARP